MRIVGGKYRSRLLITPKDEKVRPTSDITREAVFNILQTMINDAIFLDLFAGSGAMGIEAISRGAKEVFFCDNDKNSIALVKTNLQAINEEGTIIFRDYKSCLSELNGKKFDIIYIDPPYTDKCIKECLKLILENGLLSKSGYVIYESLANKDEKVTIDGFVIAKQKKYGKVMIDVYEQII